jgi:hypothetical protein
MPDTPGTPMNWWVNLADEDEVISIALSIAKPEQIFRAFYRARSPMKATRPKVLRPCKYGCGAMLGAREERYEHNRVCPIINVK